MKLLIDSSTNYLFLALCDNNNIYTFNRYGKNDHSETLVDYLHSFLQDNKKEVSDIKEVYVGRGPGSYTGLRIAGTVGKVFAFINNIKLYSFSSLDLLLSKVINQDGSYILRIDAKKNHSYYKIVNVKDKNIKIKVDETFGENTIFENYPNHIIIEMDDDLFNNSSDIVKNILNNKLYREESNLDYTPNYIRSGI